MSIFAWVVRLLLLSIVLPFIIPFGILFAVVVASPLSFALFVLMLALFVLGVFLSIALGVVGNLIDLVIVLGLIGIVWNWPRGRRGRFIDKLGISSRRLRVFVHHQLKQLRAADIAICVSLILIAVVLSLSSGLVHFFLTIVITLLVIGVVWKWPRYSRLPFSSKLRIALLALRDELRRLF
jgi:hypothetical protein